MSPSSRGFVLLSLLLSFLLPVFALQANLAGIVDWHKSFIGPPILDPTPPRIFDTAQGRRVVSITSKNVLACLDGESGDIVWRHLLDERDPVISYHVQDDSVLLLSGSGGSTARLVSLSTGLVIWEKILLQDPPRLTVPVHLGTDVGFSAETNSVLVLSDGRRITRLDQSTGKQLWSLEAPGVGDTVLFKQLLVSGSTVHILALSSGFSKTSLVTLSLSLDTSAPLSDLVHVPSIISNPSQALLAVSSTDGSSQVVWSEHGRIRTAEVDSKGSLGKTKDLMPGKGHVYDSILDVGARHEGYILGQMENMAVQIIDVRDGAKLVEEFESSHHSGDKSDSVYTAASSKSGVTFSRVYWSFSLNLAVARTYTLTSEGSIATGFTFPFDTRQHGVLQAAAVSPTIAPDKMPQILLSTSSGASLLVEQDASQWLREESLTDIASVRFVALGEREVEQVGHLLTEETFIERTSRHLLALKDLPGYLIGFAKRLTSSSYSSKLALPSLNITNLHRDQFGLQKLLVAVTRSGKVVAMDSSTGATVWSINLGLFTQTGSNIQVEDMWVVREVGEGVNPTLAVIVQKIDEDTTVGFHIDAFTGEVSGDRDETTGLPHGKTLFSGTMKTAFLTPHENCGTKNRVLAVVDPKDDLHIFPYCKTLAAKISDEAALSFTSLSESLGSRTLLGSKVGTLSDRTFSTIPQWSHHFAEGEIIHSVQPVGFDSIASFGRMLGDKSTMYKYLIPHLVVVTSSNPIKETGSVVVLDSLTGRVVYSASMGHVESSHGVVATMTENWLVFTWLERGAGWRITSVEMYEDADKGTTPEISSYAQWQDPKIVSKTFIAPSAMRSMTTTKSKFGITAKEIVYVNDRGQIAHIPRRLLDPRRPIGKPSSSDKEEQLIPYDPIIPPEPKRVISHKYQVLGATSLTSSPALVESTSLLLAHGLDLFMTRGLNPSGTFDILSDTFNKFQLLITLAVLSIGIGLAKPAVTKKALKTRWF